MKPARPSSTKLQTVLAPLFLALSLVAGRASDDRGFAVLGFGNKSCGTYVEARSERYGDSDYRGWLTGYLSARNGRFNGFYDLLEGSDLSGAMLWLENYCQSHPTEDFYRAAEALEWGRLRGLVQLQPESSTEPWEEKGKPQDAPGHAGTPKDEESPGTPTLQDAPGRASGATTQGPEAGIACPPRDTLENAQAWVHEQLKCERHPTPNDPWIEWAAYCPSGPLGYFVLKVKTGQQKVYLFENIPPAVWEGFKAAPSADKFYHSEIKGKRHSFRLASKLKPSAPELTCHR